MSRLRPSSGDLLWAGAKRKGVAGMSCHRRTCVPPHVYIGKWCSKRLAVSEAKAKVASHQKKQNDKNVLFSSRRDKKYRFSQIANCSNNVYIQFREIVLLRDGNVDKEWQSYKSMT